ncbi:hypothetical protein HPP92_021782 [Vanilla planifolia]|uniref:Uncharacterized protein n=1 Tax=Vanilla planifolia TaxID=51239 RepID=A0A835PW46_VANPL|nr:hypothetical protein HPP92_022092 [Vanilla planifolia]KAG0458654.1 hypothetical protein HPP92_021782 [Vanilla planifolia]
MPYSFSHIRELFLCNHRNNNYNYGYMKSNGKNNEEEEEAIRSGEGRSRDSRKGEREEMMDGVGGVALSRDPPHLENYFCAA